MDKSHPGCTASELEHGFSHLSVEEAAAQTYSSERRKDLHPGVGSLRRCFVINCGRCSKWRFDRTPTAVSDVDVMFYPFELVRIGEAVPTCDVTERRLHCGSKQKTASVLDFEEFSARIEAFEPRRSMMVLGAIGTKLFSRVNSSTSYSWDRLKDSLSCVHSSWSNVCKSSHLAENLRIRQQHLSLQPHVRLQVSLQKRRESEKAMHKECQVKFTLNESTQSWELFSCVTGEMSVGTFDLFLNNQASFRVHVYPTATMLHDEWESAVKKLKIEVPPNGDVFGSKVFVPKSLLPHVKVKYVSIRRMVTIPWQALQFDVAQVRDETMIWASLREDARPSSASAHIRLLIDLLRQAMEDPGTVLPK